MLMREKLHTKIQLSSHFHNNMGESKPDELNMLYTMRILKTQNCTKNV